MGNETSTFDELTKRIGDSMSRAEEYVNQHVQYKAAPLTEKATDGISESFGADKEDTKAAMPYAAAAGAGIVGLALSSPITRLGTSITNGLKKLVTGGGYLERIPVVGAVFTGLATVIDWIGSASGYLFAAAASVLTFKAFQTPPKPPALMNPTQTGTTAIPALTNPILNSQTIPKVDEKLQRAFTSTEGPFASKTQMRALEDAFGKKNLALIRLELGDSKKPLTAAQADALLETLEARKASFLNAHENEIKAEAAKSRARTPTGRAKAEAIAAEQAWQAEINSNGARHAYEISTKASGKTASPVPEPTARIPVPGEPALPAEPMASMPAAEPKGFFSGQARPGYGAAAGVVIGASAIPTLLDPDSSTEEKAVSWGLLGTGATSAGAELLGATRVAGVAGGVASSIITPLEVYNAVQSFKQGDYIEGAAHTGYATGGAAILTALGAKLAGATTVAAVANPIGLGVLAVTGGAHTAYRAGVAGKMVYDTASNYSQVDNAFEPSGNYGNIISTVQGRLRTRLEEMGAVKDVSGKFDLTNDDTMAKVRQAMEEKRQEIEKSMEDNKPSWYSRYVLTQAQYDRRAQYEQNKIELNVLNSATQELDAYALEYGNFKSAQEAKHGTSGQLTAPSTPAVTRDEDKNKNPQATSQPVP